MASSAALTTTHLPRLRKELDNWREKQPAIQPFSTPVQDILARLASTESKEIHGKDVLVAFRTRPPLENEAESKFEALESNRFSTEATEGATEVPKVEFCPGITVTQADPGVFTAHVPGMKWSGPTLTHKKFDSDLAFGPDTPNDEVYQRTVIANDLIPLALASGTACILAYGQTGTGKTYTMEALEYRIARDLFVAAAKLGEQLLSAEHAARVSAQETMPEGLLEGKDVFSFTATFLELLGKRAVDLLEPAADLPVDAQDNTVRKEIPVQEDKNGDVRPRLISREVESAEHLHALITTALSYRRTSATARNATSSRSHALLNIRIKNKLFPFAEDGQLILVDLAGSERYEDSKAHDKQRMLESRENNNSLMHLKECVRAKAKMAQEDGFVHIPWRSNKLTMLLKPIFDVESRQPSKAVIIAHVSPHIQDSVHSVSTLSYASPFKTVPPKPRGPAPYKSSDPRTWNHEQTLKWLTEEFTKQAQIRRKHSHEIKTRDAARNGKTIPLLDPDAPVTLAVDVDKLCPEGMTAKHFGAMYATEFLQRCLAVANIGPNMLASTVKDTAAEVMAKLSHMILIAKTKARRDIMKSRKNLSLDVYGDSPMDTIPGTDYALPKPGTPEHDIYVKYTPDQYLRAAQVQKSLWYERCNQAVLEAYGGAVRGAAWSVEFAEIMKLMDEYYSKVDEDETATAEE